MEESLLFEWLARRKTEVRRRPKEKPRLPVHQILVIAPKPEASRLQALKKAPVESNPPASSAPQP